MKLILACIACLTLGFAAPVLAGDPTEIQATYEVYRGSLKVGWLEERYARQGDHYTLSSATRAVGWLALLAPGRIVLSSSGLVGSSGLEPSHFSDHREKNEHKDRAAEFDWKSKKLSLIQKEGRTEVPLPAGTQDRLSAMYQFMFLTLKAGDTLAFPMTNGGKLDDYRYVVTNGGKLKTPAGDFDSLYLDSQAKKGETRSEIWLAVSKHNLPCKMIITDADGDQLMQVLSKLEVR